jgi:hypothetical protein
VSVDATIGEQRVLSHNIMPQRHRVHLSRSLHTMVCVHRSQADALASLSLSHVRASQPPASNNNTHDRDTLPTTNPKTETLPPTSTSSSSSSTATTMRFRTRRPSAQQDDTHHGQHALIEVNDEDVVPLKALGLVDGHHVDSTASVIEIRRTTTPTTATAAAAAAISTTSTTSTISTASSSNSTSNRNNTTRATAAP